MEGAPPVAGGCVDSGDTAWVLMSSVLVLGMSPALALFEAGLLGVRNTVSVLTQVIAGLSVLSVMWFLVGYSLVYGESVSGIIGSPATYVLMLGIRVDECREGTRIPELAHALFQMMFAAITPLLLTGAYSERLLFRPFLLFTVLFEILVYYPVAHWVWGGGWLAKLGAVDFAGGIVIHTTAGASALVAAQMVGRRAAFFQNHGEFPPSSVPLFFTGGALLWMGWFAFNAGSALTAESLAAAVVANTQVCSAVCATVWLALSTYYSQPNIADILNGAIAGLAGVTPASGYITVQAAAGLGLALGVASWFGIEVLKFRCHIDDALDVSSIHGITGAVGSLAIGLLASKGVESSVPNGLFYGGGATLLWHQTVAVVVAGAYAALVTWAILALLRRCGMRLSIPAGADGLDLLEHDVAAYRSHEDDHGMGRRGVQNGDGLQRRHSRLINPPGEDEWI